MIYFYVKKDTVNFMVFQTFFSINLDCLFLIGLTKLFIHYKQELLTGMI